jgi:hypothetical protein
MWDHLSLAEQEVSTSILLQRTRPAIRTLVIVLSRSNAGETNSVELEICGDSDSVGVTRTVVSRTCIYIH